MYSAKLTFEQIILTTGSFMQNLSIFDRFAFAYGKLESGRQLPFVNQNLSAKSCNLKIPLFYEKILNTNIFTRHSMFNRCTFASSGIKIKSFYLTISQKKTNLGILYKIAKKNPIFNKTNKTNH